MGESDTPVWTQYLRVEGMRYREKGLWVVLGVCLCAVTYGVVVPTFLSMLLDVLGTLKLPNAVYLTGVVMTSHHLCYVLHCAILRGVTYMGWSEHHRCNPTAEWPWNDDKDLIARTYPTLLFNFFVLIPVAIYLGLSSGSFDFPGGSSIPSAWEICRQILICMCAEDVWSFTFHRINHYRLPYRYIHKKHHEYKTSIGMTAEYAHPCEYLITNVVGVTQAAAAVGPIILGPSMRMVTFLTWLCYRIGDTVDQHGAYEFPWSPFSILPFASKDYM